MGRHVRKRSPITNTALNDEMILPYDANPGRMEFSERTPRHRCHEVVYSTYGTCYWAHMQSFKRNQAAEAISVAIGQGPSPSASLRTEMKRLLDTDRGLDVTRGSNDPDSANYAFYTGEKPGRGTEVWFSEYEIFALRLGLDLMEHGRPQATVISILRRTRPVL